MHACVQPTRLAGPLFDPRWLCLLGRLCIYHTVGLRLKEAALIPARADCDGRKWLCCVDKWRRPCALAIAKPRKTGCAVAPGCQPGYWVRLATGEALFREGEEAGGGSPQTPGSPPTPPPHPPSPPSRSPRLLFLQRHERFETRAEWFAHVGIFSIPAAWKIYPRRTPAIRVYTWRRVWWKQAGRLSGSQHLFPPLLSFTRQETLSECKFKCAFNLPMGFGDYIAAGTLHIQIASQDSGSLPLPTIVSSCWTIGH